MKTVNDLQEFKILSDNHKDIISKIQNNKRLSIEEGIELFNFDVGILGVLANFVNYQKKTLLKTRIITFIL